MLGPLVPGIVHRDCLSVAVPLCISPLLRRHRGTRGSLLISAKAATEATDRALAYAGMDRCVAQSVSNCNNSTIVLLSPDRCSDGLRSHGLPAVEAVHELQPQEPQVGMSKRKGTKTVLGLHRCSVAILSRCLPCPYSLPLSSTFAKLRCLFAT